MFYDKTNSKVGFSVSYNEEQLKNLCAELIKYEYLDKTTNEKNFVNAFNGKELNSDFKKLRWIDKSPTKSTTNAQTFYELIYLLEIKSETIDFYKKIDSLFVAIKDFKNKNPFNKRQDTDRKRQLGGIINALNLI
jgi:hypothetical protein